MKVRFAGKIYDVVDTRTIPGGVMQYAVEDEPNHIDWLTDVEIIDSRMLLDHADIVVTHQCPNRCKFCIDKFVNTSSEIVKPSDVIKFLEIISRHQLTTNEVLFLGGEPTCVGYHNLKHYSVSVRKFGYSPIISTNNFSMVTVENLTNLFDWVQVTVHNDRQIDFFKTCKNHDRINVKLAGDNSLTIGKLEHFIKYTEGFERRSVSMYFTPDFTELCTNNDVWRLLDTLEWERNGSYLYTFYEGVRIKRCIKGETNIIDEPTVPKLYPNGNYNKTWLNEDMDDYL